MQRDTIDSIPMSRPPTGNAEGYDSHPALHPSVTRVPVTPGVHLHGHSAYIDPRDGQNKSDNSTQKADKPDNQQAQSNSYFAPRDDGQVSSPTEVAAGARTGEELLRRLSLTPNPVQKPDLADVDPRAAHPGLSLSGRIISATFCLPYNIEFAPGPEWVQTGLVSSSVFFS